MAENTAEENQITSTDGFFELSQDLLCIININGYNALTEYSDGIKNCRNVLQKMKSGRPCLIILA